MSAEAIRKMYEKIQKTNAKGKGCVLSDGYGQSWRNAAKELANEGKIVIRENGEMWVASTVLPAIDVVVPVPAKPVVEPTIEVLVDPPVKTVVPEVPVVETLVEVTPVVEEKPIVINEPSFNAEMHPLFRSYRDYVGECIVKNEEPKSLAEFTGSVEAFRVPENEVSMTE